MAHVQVIQRHAHLAGAVKLEFVNGREGKVARAVLTAISNTRRASRGGAGETREETSTAIQWTLWGKQAENAAAYLGKGSHVNIVGRLRNHQYEQDGQTVHGMSFTAEEIDFLDSRAVKAARASREAFVAEMEAADASLPTPPGVPSAARTAGHRPQPERPAGARA
jgi:single-stranded DNA-binding protein